MHSRETIDNIVPAKTKPAMFIDQQHRFLVFGLLCIAYMLYTVTCEPLFGNAVMLASILLCGAATLLYNPWAGVFTCIITFPWHMIMLMYTHNDLEAWRINLEIGGPVAQLFAVTFCSILKSTREKISSINLNLEQTISARNTELRDLTNFLENKAEAERSRLSETLYREIDEDLDNMFKYSKKIRRELLQKGLEEAKDAQVLVDLAQQSIDDVNTIIRKLSLGIDETTDLKFSIMDLAAYFIESAGVDFKITISEDYKKVPAKTSQHITRIAQEAITNAMRHASATEIKIQFQVTENDCRLIIENNGHPMPKNYTPGMGLRMIKHRAQTINGNLSYSSTESGRTRFTCTIPLIRKNS